ncbi:DUF5994 family protein [Williamsia sp.]|uniref:DUF5994 family protein n=1 Tax=Williamsia sp. TaxID=1872085 RepID=UPI001A237CD2|nr:DUF5994 family protein [Williamsia sp.]MBJ7289025.1 hypothetical protein [Williamsia sp.]
MTLHDSGSARVDTAPHAPSPSNPVRLEMTPDGAPRLSVDGAWWPYSDDLETEVVGLLAALRPEYGGTERVAYRFEDWRPASRRIDSSAGQIKLDGYHHRVPETITVVGSSRRQCLLEIIPPTSSDGDARDAMAHVRGTTSVAV